MDSPLWLPFRDGQNPAPSWLAQEVMRLARLQAGLSVEAFGFKIGVSPTAVSAYENGEVAPSLDTYIAALGAVGVDPVPVLFGPLMSYDHYDLLDDNRSPLDMDRRRFLQLIAAAAALAMDQTEWSNLLLHEGRVAAERPAPEEFRALVRRDASQWGLTAPSSLLPRARQDLVFAKQLAAQASTPTIGKAFLGAQAEAGLLVGWLSMIAGNRGDARIALGDAEVSAIEAGESDVVTQVRIARSSLVSAVDRGTGNPHLAMEMIQGALESAGDGSCAGTRAFGLARRAEECACQGRLREAMQDLEWAREEQARGKREPGIFAKFDEAQLQGFYGSCVAMLGRQRGVKGLRRKAIAENEDALAHTDEALVPQRAALAIDLAACLADEGEVERAAELLGNAYRPVRARGLVERVERIMNVRWRNLNRYREVGAVRRLDEQLGSLM